MRRVLSTVLAVALLLGLGALAVLALPNANASLAEAPAVSAGAPEFAPDAPAATENYNFIAMPLNSQNQFTSAGLTFTADGLAGLIGSGVTQVLKWDAAAEQYVTRYPQFNIGENFALAVGGTYFVLLDSSATSTVVSFVGDVPNQGTIKNTLTGAIPCVYNSLSIPLDQSVADAAGLGTALVDAEQVLNWDAASQQWQTYYPAFGIGPNFQVKIGYPYFACMKVGKTWPQ